jgi:Hemerythrin HHE cation binding domain
MSTPQRTADSMAAGQDALALLQSDHHLIRGLILDHLETTTKPGFKARAVDRRGFVVRLSAMLRVHARIEDEIFYPALLANAGAAAVQHAMADHADIATRLEAVVEANPFAADFDRLVAALARAVDSHFEAEESALFAAAAGLDLAALGQQLALRRAALVSDMSVE